MHESDIALSRFNEMSREEAIEQMRRCCGATAWCEAVVNHRPYGDRDALHHQADIAFAAFDNADWLEAFSHHPKIGDIQSLKMKFAGNREWSGDEQAGTAHAEDEVIARLAEGNVAYEAKFGFIFIVCATGKTAREMLSILESRLPSDRDAEISNAAIEQKKITHLRIDKWSID
jgi:2-oxo-4-hydroxy-4-carboxy-5-ureidoimidazoline decarboxylase